MTDKKSVAQALNDSLRNQHCGFIEGVGNVYAVSEETIKDTLELLKEQKAVVRCKDCKHAVLTTSGEVKYCKYWQSDEDGTYGGDPLYLDGNFYCAAGERR